jgi:hypothetical protein
MIYRIEFEYDNGYGEITPVKAQVQIVGETAEVLETDCCDRDGGNLPQSTMDCIDEMATEIAWRLHEQKEKV